MFLFSYFRFGIEGLHLALSEDGLHWRVLNANAPVFASNLGTKSLRDPFLLRDKNGLFHLFATNGWTGTDCFHAVCDDVSGGRSGRLMPVMDKGAGARNGWAPEVFCEKESGLYYLIWSSSTAEQIDTLHDWHQRVWSSSSENLENWTPAAPLFDFGFSVIDPCFVQEKNGSILMAFKDERGKNRGHENEASVQSKAIKIARAPHIGGPWKIEDGFVSPNLSEGPTLFWRHDSELGEGWTVLFDHFGALQFGASHCADGKNWVDISDRLKMVEGRPHHGSVLEISSEEAAKLEQFFAANRIEVAPQIAPPPTI